MILSIWLKIKNKIPKGFSKKIKYIYTFIFSLLFPSGFYKQVDFLNIRYLIKVDPKNGPVDNVILWDNVMDGDHLKILKKYLREGDVFIDIGANIGQYSLFASQCVKLKGKVISFEPVLDIFNQFQDSIIKNNFKNIFAYNKACGDEDTFLEINKKNGDAGGSSFLNLNWSKENKKEKVEVLVLDNFLINENIINFIKIDVEGFEYEVLQGMNNIIDKFKPILFIEYSPHIYVCGNKNNSENILIYLLDKNYNIFDVGSNKKVEDIDYAMKENIDMTNLLCISK